MMSLASSGGPNSSSGHSISSVASTTSGQCTGHDIVYTLSFVILHYINIGRGKVDPLVISL